MAIKQLSSKMALLAIPFCIAAQAGDTKAEKESEIFSGIKGLTIELSLSVFSFETHELLYQPQATGDGRKESELIYKADNVKLIGLNLDYAIVENLDVYFGYKQNISAGNGLMEDFDWADDANPDNITHQSYHDNTDIANVSVLDLGIKKGFMVQNISFCACLGYKQEKMKIKSYNGYGIYYGIPVTFSGLGLTFDQEYKGPYLGIGTDYKYKDFIFDFGVRYSPLMRTTYTDRHHLIPFTEKARFDDTSMVHVNLGAGYQVDENQRISFTYVHTKYAYVRGNRIRTFDDGSVYSWPNTSAVESKNSTLALAYGYRF